MRNEASGLNKLTLKPPKYFIVRLLLYIVISKCHGFWKIELRQAGWISVRMQVSGTILLPSGAASKRTTFDAVLILS